MTKLEKIALEQLATKLRSIVKRCGIENIDKMGAERLSILKDAKYALEIADAIDQNDDRNYDQKEIGETNTIGLR